MTASARWRWLAWTAAGGLTLLAAGCFPSRMSVYNELERERALAFARWRREAGGQESLAHLKGPLSLPDAVRVALRHNPGLLTAFEERVKAEAQVWRAGGEALPIIELRGDYTRLDQVRTVDLGTATFQVGDRDNYSTQLEVTQPLFKGGAIPAALRGAAFLRYWSDEIVRTSVQNVIRDTARAYYDILLAEQLYKVQEDALAFAEANLRDVIAREQAQVAVAFDRLRAQVEVSNVKADLISQRTRLNKARTALYRVMGVSQRSEVTLSDEIVYAEVEQSYEEAVEKAFLRRPELYEAELDMRVQTEMLHGLRSDYLPTLEAWAWRKQAKPDPHEASRLAWGSQWAAGVRLVWTVFDGFQRKGHIMGQRAVLRQAAIKLADAEQEILEEIKNAMLDLQDAGELHRSQRLNLERANEALRLVQVGVKEGVNTELELLDARAALTRARGLYYEALHKHAVARLDLQRAMGLLAPPVRLGRVPRPEAPASAMEMFAPSEEGGPQPETDAQPENGN